MKCAISHNNGYWSAKNISITFYVFTFFFFTGCRKCTTTVSRRKTATGKRQPRGMVTMATISLLSGFGFLDLAMSFERKDRRRTTIDSPQFIAVICVVFMVICMVHTRQ